jgi:small subunit ribosomal protein S14
MGTKIHRKIMINKQIRFRVKKYELKKKVLKFIFLQKNYNYLKNLYYFQNFNENSSISLIKNICIQTGRSRGVLRFFKLSRLKVKELGNLALIPGLRRAS